MIDLDHFKQINDRHGHLVGDECLRWSAGVIGQTLRQHNALLARFGGEEFVVALPGMDLDTAASVAEELRLDDVAARLATSANPWRHDGCAGRQPSSRLALALEPPRTSVIIATICSPANNRPSQAGTRIGRLAPSKVARTGSHSLTGAGSSSTML